MTEQDKLLALAIKELNRRLQTNKITRVQIDSSDDMELDGTCSVEVYVEYRPITNEGVNDNE